MRSGRVRNIEALRVKGIAGARRHREKKNLKKPKSSRASQHRRKVSFTGENFRITQYFGKSRMKSCCRGTIKGDSGSSMYTTFQILGE